MRKLNKLQKEYTQIHIRELTSSLRNYVRLREVPVSQRFDCSSCQYVSPSIYSQAKNIPTCQKSALGVFQFLQSIMYI